MPLARRLQPSAGASMHIYRTHTCNALTAVEIGREARLSGWVHRKRDHGNLLFIDLRDHYGVTQCVIDTSSPLFKVVEAVRVESVVTVTGKVGNRPPETVNRKLATGEVQPQIAGFTLPSAAEGLPLPVASGEDKRGGEAALPLPRFAARQGTPQHRAALAGHPEHPQADDRAGLHRVPDSDPDLELAGGGP